MSVKFNYSRLLGRIIEKCGSRVAFAEKAKISTTALVRKMSGKVAFRNDEIVRMSEVLEIPIEEAHLYFFCQES